MSGDISRRAILADGVEVWLADCRDVLPTIGRVDAVVTDPPYGLGKRLTRQGLPHPRGWGMQTEKDVEWDTLQTEGLAASIALSREAIVWGGNFYHLPQQRGWIVWNKRTRGFSSGDCELAWTSLDRPIRAFDLGTNVFTPIVPNHEQKEHPTQKPLALMEWCIKQLPVGCETIIDPFMGSGTTGVAAVNLGRKFIGIEINEQYFDIARRRISEALKQPDLLIERPRSSSRP